MSEDTRATLTVALWFLSTLVLIALFISAAVIGELTAGHILFAFVILALAVVTTPILLRWKDTEMQTEKTKRRRIDSLLHELSDQELVELKQRLSDGDYSVETIMDSLGDDGELVRRN
jgi:hypothetical protein